MMTVGLIIWGIWSATKLPIDAVPDITNNQVQIITNCPTLASQEVEQLVTYPIETEMTGLPELQEMRSFSRFGISVITLVFKDDVDIYFARQLISERLKAAEAVIPASIGKPVMAPVTTGLGEIYQYVIHPKKGSEDKYSAMDLRTLQDWIVSRQLKGIEGVAEITGFGGISKQYEVAINPDKLKAMEVTIPEIFTALKKNNENTGGAYIDKRPNAYFIRGIGRVKTLQDIEQIAIKSSPDGIPVLIRDVARVGYGAPPRYGAMTYNGEKEVVGGIVLMLKGANSNEVVQSVKQRMKTIQQSLPKDIIIEPFLDRSKLVNNAIHTVEKNLIEGALIVIFVLVIFLGNLRAGLIVASAIPLSLLFALGLMRVFGVSANLMSLGAIDFGLIVDGAVIIVEATLHHLGLRKSMARLSQAEMDQEVFFSASKIRSSAAFGEIIILIVYIPILTLTGIEGKMFTPMAKTVSFAILGALILSLTYIPMMSALFLSKNKTQKPSFSDKMMQKFQNIYKPLLQKAIRFKFLIISGTVILFGASLLLFKSLGGEFIPQLQEGDFAFEFVLPQGSSLSQTTQTVMQAERIVRQFQEVKMVVGKTGAADVATDPMPMNQTDIMVILKPKKQWPSTLGYYQLADSIQQKLAVIPGVIAEPSQPIQMRFNELMTGIRQDVAVKIFGENLDTLSELAPSVARIIQKIPGVSEPVVERTSGLPGISVLYDRAKISAYGLNIEDISRVLETAFAGQTAGQVFENERRFDLVVRLDSAHRQSISNVADLYIPLPGGNQIPLSQVATVAYKEGPAQISREDGKRRVVIGFNVHDRDVSSVVADIKQALNKELELPTGYYLTYGGQFENLQRASNRLMIAVPVSLLLIFMLLYFTFKSIKQATLIFTAIPMSAIGGVLALYLRGMPFSISAGVGFIALFGVAVLNGIVLIGTFNQLEKEGIKDIFSRVMQGTRERLRPVLMTATVASLGFLPMAISTGAGAEVQKPLATVVIGGLLTATFLTLFVLPLLYILFHTKINFKMRPVAKMLTVLVLSGFGYKASAQSIKIQSADQAIGIALENNGAVKAGQLRLNAAKVLEKTAGELPKLNLGTELGQFNSHQFDNSFQVSQTLPFPGLFTARKQLAQAESKASALENRGTVNDLRKRVRISYYQILYLQHNQQQLAYLDSLYQDFIRIAELRFQTGDTKKLDITNTRVQKGKIALLATQNGTYLNAAYQNLQMLLNTRDSLEITPTSDYQPLPLEQLLDSTDITLHPMVQALYQKSAVAAKNARVEKAKNAPDLTVGYNNQSLIGLQNISGQERLIDGGKRFSYINIGIAIPLSIGAGKARVRASQLESDAAMAEAEQKTKDLQSSLANAVSQYQQDQLSYQYYKEQALPSAAQIVEAAKTGYTLGDIGYVEFLYSLETATDIRLNYLKSIQQLNETAIQIYYLTNQ